MPDGVWWTIKRSCCHEMPRTGQSIGVYMMRWKMEKYLNKGIKEIIDQFPEVENALNEYDIGCAPCTVGKFRMKGTYGEETICEFLNILAQDTPLPAGGSIAAYYKYASFFRICAPWIWSFLLCRRISTFYEIVNFSWAHFQNS